jgi:hypothetical protein
MTNYVIFSIVSLIPLLFSVLWSKNTQNPKKNRLGKERVLKYHAIFRSNIKKYTLKTRPLTMYTKYNAYVMISAWH